MSDSMDYMEEMYRLVLDSNYWGRRDSKKKTKKNFTSDNRKSVRWLFDNTIKKAKIIKEARERKRKEQDSWLQN